jgi:hypothetical protein
MDLTQSLKILQRGECQQHGSKQLQEQLGISKVQCFDIACSPYGMRKAYSFHTFIAKDTFGLPRVTYLQSRYSAPRINPQPNVMGCGFYNLFLSLLLLEGA